MSNTLRDTNQRHVRETTLDAIDASMARLPPRWRILLSEELPVFVSPAAALDAIRRFGEAGARAALEHQMRSLCADAYDPTHPGAEL